MILVPKYRKMHVKGFSISILIYILCIFTCSVRAADYLPEQYRYEIMPAGTGANETFLYRVICVIKNPAQAADAASACAVHGVIFRGCGKNGNFPEQTPLCQYDTLTDTQKAYYDRLFNDDNYRQYVVSVARGSIKITKVKKEYQAEVIVSVNKRKLRRDLENSGMIEKLGAIFQKQTN